MKKLLLAMSFILFSLNVYSGELAKDATIQKLGNTRSGGADFYIRITGGTGVCANSLVSFPENKQASEASNNQAFSIALAAMTTGKKVRIYNFNGNSCYEASYIEITN